MVIFGACELRRYLNNTTLSLPRGIWWRIFPSGESALVRNNAGCRKAEDELRNPSVAAERATAKEMAVSHRFEMGQGAQNGAWDLSVPGVLVLSGVFGEFLEL